jgi:hypothetical protein
MKKLKLIVEDIISFTNRTIVDLFKNLNNQKKPKMTIRLFLVKVYPCSACLKKKVQSDTLLKRTRQKSKIRAKDRKGSRWKKKLDPENLQ